MPRVPHHPNHSDVSRPSENLAQFVGSPRSVAWRQGAVHLRAAGGGAEVPDLHAHFAIQLSVGIKNEIALRTSRRAAAQWAEAWLVASDQPHWMNGRGAIVTIFWDPVSTSGRRAAKRLAQRETLALAPAEGAAMRRRLQASWKRGWRVLDLHAAADELAIMLAPGDLSSVVYDARVQAVLDEIVLGSSENTSLADLAARVGLSESRLSHLFRRDVGLPMRQYRLTLRMQAAVKHMIGGSSLTEAAHAAGFADSSHFCRICRRMSGMAPSNLPDFEIQGQ